MTLKPKHVVIAGNSMALWNELGAFVARYDRSLDREMCRFLDRMIAENQYTREVRSGAEASRHAA